MNAETAWLPPLVLLEDSRGHWNDYEEVLYVWFRRDFVESKPSFPGKRVQLKRHPLSKGKEATFWHFISEGEFEEDREIDLRRCERIRWPRPMIDAFPDRPAPPESPVVWWKSLRGNEWRYVIALRDYSYVVVLADRGDYVLPWTAYFVERPKRQIKLKNECDGYWQGLK